MRLAPLLALLSALPAVSSAQTLVLFRSGQLSSGNFGAACDGAGFVDADGVADFVVGADRTTPNLTFAGTGTAHSGADASVLWEYNGSSLFEFLGQTVAGVGDLDGDGRGDFLIATGNDDTAASNAGRARVYSGSNGFVIHTFLGAASGDNLGSDADGAGRVDGDSVPDVIVGIPGMGSTGGARVYSGSTGQVLHTFMGTVAGSSSGSAVSAAGDVDGDGRDDLMMSAPLQNTGRVLVYSGATGAVLHTLLGGVDDGGFGGALAGPGDLNGDGHADLVVGASGATLNGVAGGAVYVYSGADGSVLHTYRGTSSGESMGESVGDGGDVDGDGTPDFLVGVPRSSENGIFSGRVEVISGATGLELFRVFGLSSNYRFGDSCAIMGDASGDGLDDVLVGAPGALSSRGRIFLYRYDPELGTRYCDPAVPNSTGEPALLRAFGSSLLADGDVRLLVEDAPGGEFAYGLTSQTQGLTPMAGGSLGTLCLGGAIGRRVGGFIGPLPQTGALTITVDLGAQPTPTGNVAVQPGDTWNFQVWFRDAGGTSNFTNGVSVDFQ